MIDVPKRNRAVKALLEITYGKGSASVTAGRGSARHWVMIEFHRHVDKPAGMLHNRFDDAIADLIKGAGIELSSFPASDDGTSDVMLPCIEIAMPRKAP